MFCGHFFCLNFAGMGVVIYRPRREKTFLACSATEASQNIKTWNVASFAIVNNDSAD